MLKPAVHRSLSKHFAVPVESLNTGLCMRRTGETSYGRQRRFILANPAIKTPRKSSILDSDIGRIERRFCDRYGIPYIEPSDVGSQRDHLIRACDRCFQIGHHSKYFTCQWLTRCPVHGRTLSTSCSGCGAAWPVGSDMLNRNCKVCGRSTRLADLSFNNAFDIKLFEKKISPLLELENIYKFSHFLDFYSFRGSDSTSNWHRSTSFFSDRLPRALSLFSLQAAGLFHDLGARQAQHAKVCSFGAEGRLAPSEWSKQIDAACEKAVKDISKKIRKRYAVNSSLIDNQEILKGLPPLLRSCSASSLAYSIWIFLVDPRVRLARKQQALRLRSDRLPFLIPIPMTVCGPTQETLTQVLNSKYSYLNPWTAVESCLYPPVSLVEFIYRRDLIACYKTIHEFYAGQVKNCSDYPSPESECYGGDLLIKFNGDLQTYDIALSASGDTLRCDPTIPKRGPQALHNNSKLFKQTMDYTPLSVVETFRQ